MSQYKLGDEDSAFYTSVSKNLLDLNDEQTEKDGYNVRE